MGHSSKEPFTPEQRKLIESEEFQKSLDKMVKVGMGSSRKKFGCRCNYHDAYDAVINDMLARVKSYDGSIPLNACFRFAPKQVARYAARWMADQLDELLLRDGNEAVGQDLSIPASSYDPDIAIDGYVGKNLLANLPNKERMFLILYFGLDGRGSLSMRELADYFGVSGDTVCCTIHRGLEAIQVDLGLREKADKRNARKKIDWNHWKPILGKKTDTQLAKEIGVTQIMVSSARRKFGIPRYKRGACEVR